MKKEDNRIEIIKGIGTIFLFFILPVVYQLSIMNIYNKVNRTTQNILLLIGEILLFGVLIYMYKDRFKGTLKDFKKNKKEYTDIMFKSWLLGFIAMFVSNLIVVVLLKNGIAGNEAANRTLLQTRMLYALPSVVFFGPVCEELTFRASFKKAINNKVLFVIITSLLFGGAHLFTTFESIKDLIYLLPYSSIGFSLGYIYSKTDNVLTNILTHIFHNTLSVLLILIAI